MRKIHIKRFSPHAKRVSFVNAITAAALVCGLTSIISAAQGEFFLSARLILGAMILDGLDGTFARALKAESQFGAEFDTFVDLTAFGIAPAMLVYFSVVKGPVGVLLACAIVLSGAIRLARFKVVDEDHGMSGYTGMPITANALCLAGLILFISSPAWTEGANPWTWIPEWFNLSSPWVLGFMYVNCILGLLLQLSPFKYPKPTNTPIGQFVGVLMFIGLFLNPKTAVISCCYLVPSTLFYVYLSPFWYVIKQKIASRKSLQN